MLEEALLGAIVAGAGETGEVEEDGNFVEGIGGCLRGQVEVQGHFAIGGGGIVGEFEELTAKGGNGCLCLERHCCEG